MPASRTKRAIAEILRDEGFIESFEEAGDGAHPELKITLKYVGKVPVISGLKRDQQARPACLRDQDRHPARARRPGRRHRQHQPRDHDRRAAPARRSSAAKSWRTSGRCRYVTNRQTSHSRSRAASTSQIDGNHVAVKGPKGELERDFAPELQHRPRGRRRCASSAPTTSAHRELHGLTRTLVANMVIGVTPASARASRSPASATAPSSSARSCSSTWATATRSRSTRPQGVAFEVENPTRLAVIGIDKELVGHVAARDPRAPASRSPTRARACVRR